ncbi:aldo/keto reductase [uncultured Amnibacterium sp.]|uniref:aldo/keto reductase n=1 Tax=uncultured Amnibacterium sp. TaxID=1631851 RepID=UPI0035CC588E
MADIPIPTRAVLTPEGTVGAGARLPAIGLGTYGLRGAAGVAAVGTAIDAGFRLLDTAFNYDNEGAVGRAIIDSTVPRDELIYSTKLPGRYHGYELALQAVEESLFRSGLDRLDLVLIHWPNPSVRKYVEAWRALVEARERGLVRMIGVSNFLPEHLDRIIGDSGVVPVLNQIEVHPYHPQDEVRAANAERGILTEGWSPLGASSDLIGHDIVTGIAEAHGTSPALVLLAWSIALGVIPLPKSATAARQAANLTAFDLELGATDLDRLRRLAGTDGRRHSDPSEHEEM